MFVSSFVNRFLAGCTQPFAAVSLPAVCLEGLPAPIISGQVGQADKCYNLGLYRHLVKIDV